MAAETAARSGDEGNPAGEIKAVGGIHVSRMEQGSEGSGDSGADSGKEPHVWGSGPGRARRKARG